MKTERIKKKPNKSIQARKKKKKRKKNDKENRYEEKRRKLKTETV